MRHLRSSTTCFRFEANERIRLKVRTNETVESVTERLARRELARARSVRSVWSSVQQSSGLATSAPAAGLGRISVTKGLSAGVCRECLDQKHLPEMSDVDMEQLQQRRAYGLEILSVPQERLMREIFRGGKEVMPKDK